LFYGAPPSSLRMMPRMKRTSFGSIRYLFP
jgi:hypothetical protein